MHNENLTKQDLQQFKSELLQEMKQMIQPANVKTPQWLKSIDVREMLQISAGTLKSLRETGMLNYTRLRGILYYSLEDIVKLLEKHKTPNQSAKP